MTQGDYGQWAPQPQYAATNQQPSGNRGVLIAVGIVIALLLALLIGVLVFLGLNGKFGADSADRDSALLTVVETQTESREQDQEERGGNGQSAPPPAVAANPCPYANVAAVNSVTTGPFAQSVYGAFMDACTAQRSPNVAIRAYSPVTERTYTMNCSGGAEVYCRGGNNAVVRIW